jgi:hypothetical protein
LLLMSLIWLFSKSDSCCNSSLIFLFCSISLVFSCCWVVSCEQIVSMLSPVLDSLDTTDLSSLCIFQLEDQFFPSAFGAFNVSVVDALLMPLWKFHCGSNFFVVQSKLSVVSCPIMLVVNHVLGFVAAAFGFRGLIVGLSCWQMILHPPCRECWMKAKILFAVSRSQRLDVFPWWVMLLDRTLDLFTLLRPSPATKKYFLRSRR